MIGSITLKNVPIFSLPVLFSVPRFQIAVNLFYIAVVISWIFIIPLDKAPDEYTHYNSNVKFIATKKRLPISGKDDRAVYRNCTGTITGVVPCTYSYSIYPSVNYIASAIVGVTLSKMTSLELWRAARFASLLWGLLFINSVFFLVKELINGDAKTAAIVSLPFQIHPQSMYIASYINQDIHSLALATLTLYCLVRWWKNPSSTKFTVAFGASYGFLLVAKYNYFILCLLIGAAFLYRFLTARGAVPENIRRKNGLAWLCVMLPLPLFFYGRNYYYYHDFLGQQFMINRMARYHPLGPVTPLNNETLEILWNDWLPTLYKSFFGLFDYLLISLPDAFYILFGFGVITSWIITFSSMRKGTCYEWTATATLALFTFASFALVLFNTLAINYQPQGRYLFPIIPAFALWSGYILKQHPKLQLIYGVWSIAFVTSVILATEAFLQTY